MKFIESSISGLFEIVGAPHADDRGSFERLYCKREFAEIGFQGEFVQVNLSQNARKGTFRGLHYQMAPYQETKMIRCVRGRAIDIAVDLRANSPTFLRSVQIEISEARGRAVLLPKGVAHGFMTVEDNTSLLYHHTEYFNAEADRGLRYSDPRLQLTLPAPVVVISNKDQQYPLLAADFKGI